MTKENEVLNKSYAACECKPEYLGVHCQYRNACFINPCLHNGSCSTLNNTDFDCTCQNSYVGKTCELGK